MYDETQFADTPTVLPYGFERTEETDKTDAPNVTNGFSVVSNGAFLAALFGSQPSDLCPVVVSFKGNPAKVAKAAWWGVAWCYGTAAPAPEANNYFSLAAFRPDESGQYRRRKAQFNALHAVMLDDVGTKVALDRLTLPPSWLLETSPDNFQAGYILKEPIQETVVADRLVNAIVAAGLCDPGANGPTARLARLPEAVNGKHDPAFHCRMREWESNRRYTIQELIDGLQLDMRPLGRPQVNADNRHAEDSDCDGPVLIPSPTENAVVAALRVKNLYKAPLGDGKHDVTCPWVAEHGGASDGGTAYFEPDAKWPLGGFKCLHGHCAHRHICDLLQFLCVAVSAARMKPIIRVVSGEIPRIVDAAEQELAKMGRYYQRGSLIVTVGTDPGTKETSVRDINPPALIAALAGAATWERFDGRSKQWVRTDPSQRHVSVLFDAIAYPHLPVLNGLTRQPYFRPDGTLVTRAGYDASTGMFGVFAEKDFSVPSQPSKADAEAALHLLVGLLAEFRFAKPADKAATLAAFLTATIRPTLAHAPMFHVRAPQIASGKSHLCRVIIAFATPQRGTPTTFPHDDEECRKMLLAELLRVPAVIEFDNLTGDLVPHKSLCIALTSEHFSGRILGISKTATVSTRTLFLSSGNNVGPVQDMARRCVTINLDPACETPASRTFSRPDLVQDVQRERGRYVSAALTIMRAWIVAGRPKSPCRAMAGFEDWSDMCRQSLLWLGQTDPADAVFEAMSDDPDREMLARLLAAWKACFDRKPTMVRQAVDFEGFSDLGMELREVLYDIAGEREMINRRVLGRWIKRHAGRIVNGIRFVRAGGSRSAEAWVVESVS